jgi:excisionase family DNA binding protein
VSELLTPEVIAQRLKIKPSTVMKYLRRGVIRGHKVGRLWRVTEEDFQAYLDRIAQPPPEERREP